MWWGYLNVCFLIQSSGSLLLWMLQCSISHTSFWFSSKLSCWIWLFRHGSKWIICFVVSSVKHSWSLEVRSQLELMHAFSPLFEVGKHLWVIHVNTTYLGNRYPFPTKYATKICLGFYFPPFTPKCVLCLYYPKVFFYCWNKIYPSSITIDHNDWLGKMQ
jgi:hypothetical protein